MRTLLVMVLFSLCTLAFSQDSKDRAF